MFSFSPDSIERRRHLDRLRKTRQRQKSAGEGNAAFEVELPKATIEILAETARLTGGTIKEQIAWLVQKTAVQHLSELEKLAARGGELWLRAEPYLRYAGYLTKPGQSFRIGSTILNSSDWLPISQEIGAIFATLQNSRGWSHTRTCRFLETAAAKLRHTVSVTR